MYVTGCSSASSSGEKKPHFINSKVLIGVKFELEEIGFCFWKLEETQMKLEPTNTRH